MNAITELQDPIRVWTGPKVGAAKTDWRICQIKLADWMKSIHPRDTIQNMVVDMEKAGTPLSDGTLHNYLYMKSKPRFENGWALFVTYGYGFLANCLREPPEWVLVAAKQEELKRVEAEIARLKEERDRLDL